MLNSLFGTWHNLRKKPRFWILLFFLVISLLVLIIPALKSKPELQASTWEVIFQTFFATVLTASLVELSVTTSENYLKESDRRYFRQLFSCDFNTDESVAIVLPAFDIEKPTETENAFRENIDTSEEIIQSTKKELAEAGSKTAQWEDVITASNIALAFSRFELPVPKIIRHDEAIEHLYDENSNIKTFISIGLLTNKLTLDINKREKEERYFKIKKEEGLISKITIKLGIFDNNNNLMDEDYWESYDSKWDTSQFKPDGEEEHMLLAKTKTYIKKKEKTVIILGGCMRTGTEIGGKFIVENLINSSNSSWEKTMKNFFAQPSTKYLNESQFAVVYLIPLIEDSKKIKPENSASIRNKCPLYINR